MTRTLIENIATLIDARDRSVENGNHEWAARHYERLEQLVKDYLPRGSGIDMGCRLDYDRSTGERVVIVVPYHMDEHGYYDGWTDYTLVVKPSLQFGIILKLLGKDRNGIKDYLLDLMYEALTRGIPIAGDS